jgi:hypothetical protein
LSSLEKWAMRNLYIVYRFVRLKMKGVQATVLPRALFNSPQSRAPGALHRFGMAGTTGKAHAVIGHCGAARVTVSGCGHRQA